MALRKPHSKTRRGCAACKKRRVKCDEAKPTCRNCEKRGIECSFQHIHPSTTLSSSSSPQGQEDPIRVLVFAQETKAPQPEPLINLPASAVWLEVYQGCPDLLKSRFTDLHQHFMRHASKDLVCHAPSLNAWQNGFPQLAANDKFVLHGLLAIASLHQSRQQGRVTEQKLLTSIAASEMNHGLSHYRSEVQHVTRENASSLLAFSALTTIYFWTLAGDECATILDSIESSQTSDSQVQDDVERLVRTILNMLHCLRGQRLILSPGWKHIMRGNLSTMVSRELWPPTVSPTSPEALEDDRRLAVLELMWMEDGVGYDYSHAALASALKQLRDTFALAWLLTVTPDGSRAATSHGTFLDKGLVIAWPFRLTQEYVNLMEQRQPEAWIIYAHHAILMERNQSFWLTDGKAYQIIATTALLLKPHQRKWLQWPAEVVGLDLARVDSRHHHGL